MDMESGEKQYITFVTEDGTEQEAEVVMCFEAGTPKKKYIIYTFNEKDKNNMVSIYSAILIENKDGYQIQNIVDDHEWSMVKEVMRHVVVNGRKENVDGTV